MRKVPGFTPHDVLTVATVAVVSAPTVIKHLTTGGCREAIARRIDSALRELGMTAPKREGQP